MNDFSFSLVMLFGILFSFIFKNILLEAGLKKERLNQWYLILVLPFLAMVGFFLFPLIYYGNFELNTIEFYNSTFFWISVSFLVGGIVRFIYDKVKKK